MTRTGIAILIVATAFSASACTGAGGGSSGWVRVGSTPAPPPPAASRPGAEHPGQGKGLEVAARNHIRTANRFLEQGKPDHAMRELEKARAKMGSDYWFHYCMGGAYFLKGMFNEAGDSWERAYGLTTDARLRSRSRTLQSFAAFSGEGSQPSVGFLRGALELDSGNVTARELPEELNTGEAGQAGLQRSAKPGKGKKDRDKDRDKEKKKGKKIEQQETFKAYFFVEIP